MLKQDAEDEHKINLYHAEDALYIHVTKPAFGIFLHEEDIPEAKHVRLHWGVSTYPEGASYEHGIDSIPPVSGISIEVDTTASKNDGKAASFLQRIEFLN